MEQWRKDNPEGMKLWRAANPGYHRDWDSRRRAEKYGAVARLTPRDIERLFWFQDGHCHYCAGPLGSDYHIDHMLPLSRGGQHTPENVCLACRACNFRKHTQTAEEFLAELSRAAM